MENKSITSASLRNYRGSARKARLLLDMIRGKQATEAKNILQFSTKKMAKDIHKLLLSAIANANQKEGKIKEQDLYVETAFADEGVTMKRMMLAIKGMAYTIRKRSCHITLKLGKKAEEETLGTKN
jgi:large subunit ribosomal protein L22